MNIYLTETIETSPWPNKGARYCNLEVLGSCHVSNKKKKNTKIGN